MFLLLSSKFMIIVITTISFISLQFILAVAVKHLSSSQSIDFQSSVEIYYSECLYSYNSREV